MQVSGQLLLPDTSRDGADQETASSKAFAFQAQAAQHGQALLKQVRLVTLQFDHHRLQEQMGIRPYLLALFRLKSRVGTTQVFIDDALMRPVLVDQVETAIRCLSQDYRLLQLRQWSQGRQDFSRPRWGVFRFVLL